MSNLIPNSLPQPQSSESNKPDPSKFYDEIIRDSMSGSSFGDSQNPKVRRLHGKASTLAATALATTTKANYGRAWGRLLGFCAKMGFNPMEVSGLELATWLTYRAEQTSSPNMLDSDLKAVKSFRQAAKNHF